MTSADDLPALPALPEPTSIDPGRFGVMWQDEGALLRWRDASVLAARAERDAEIERLKTAVAAAKYSRDEAMNALAQRDEKIRECMEVSDHWAVKAHAAEARVKELSEKENEADMCLQSVHEARKIIKEHLGGNCAFLDDDLVRWVVRGLDEIKEERDVLRAQLAHAEDIIRKAKAI